MRKGKDPKGNLRRAERKIHQFSDTQEWCGCLTVSEALALYEDGAQPINSNLYSIEGLKQKQAEGDGRPYWFYFYPSRKQLTRWLNR